MLCPNCDGVLNKTGCQACGWKVGDPHVRDERVFPFNARAEYPAGTGPGWFAKTTPEPTPPQPGSDEEKIMNIVRSKMDAAIEGMKTYTDDQAAAQARALPDPAANVPTEPAGVPTKPERRKPKPDVTIQ